MAENDLTKNFTISVRNVPNAKIFIECKERSFIEVEQGTICHWKVSAPGYKDQIGEIKIVSDINLTLTLQKVPPKPTFSELPRQKPIIPQKPVIPEQQVPKPIITDSFESYEF